MYIAITRVENNRGNKFLAASSIALLNDLLDKPYKDKTVREYFPDLIIYDNSANTPERDLWIDGQIVTIVPVIDPGPTGEEIIRTKREAALEELLMDATGTDAIAYREERSRQGK